MRRTPKFVTLIAVVGAITLMSGPAAVGDGVHPGLSPTSVERTILPGQSYDVEKTVHTPDLPPTLDVCLVVDLSGSYDDDLPNIASLAPGIWDDIVAGGVSDLRFGLATFVDYPFPSWGSTIFPDYAYRLDQQLTSSRTDWLTAVSAMTTRDGFDEPESQYEALYQVATGAGRDVTPAGASEGDVAPGQECAYREDATKVVILTTDASFHDAGDGGGPFPYPGPTAADTEAALVAQGIKVIGLKAPGAGGELDALAAATGGTTVPTTSTSSDIATRILAALEEIDVEVAMTSNCTTDTGGVITTTFAPPSVTVENGEDAVFTETISVASDAPGGVYECEDWALIDGQPMVDADGNVIYETKTILVPENFVTGGGNITTGQKGKDRVSQLTFGGNAGYLPDGTLVGHWTFDVHFAGWRFQTTEITALQFVDTGVDPAPPTADADTAVMTAEGRGNFGDGWVDGCTIQVTFHDGGEPQQDGISGVSMSCPGHAVVGSADLTGGNIQIHEGTKD
ncbi:MAG TPA: hypothetical protein VFI44_02080 [Ornithinibacter sp.]|nr:hypothetical protein [Ornithinibacter sp.]